MADLGILTDPLLPALARLAAIYGGLLLVAFVVSLILRPHRHTIKKADRPKRL